MGQTGEAPAVTTEMSPSGRPPISTSQTPVSTPSTPQVFRIRNFVWLGGLVSVVVGFVVWMSSLNGTAQQHSKVITSSTDEVQGAPYLHQSDGLVPFSMVPTAAWTGSAGERNKFFRGNRHYFPEILHVNASRGRRIPPCELIGQSVNMTRCAPRVLISGMKCATNGMEAALLKHPAMRSIPDTETSYFYSFDKSGLTNPRTAPEFLKHLPKVSKKQSEQRVYTIQSSTAHMRPPVWDVARAYSQHFPRVKIIFMLCDPVARLYSDFYHRRRFGPDNEYYEPGVINKTFEEALGLRLTSEIGIADPHDSSRAPTYTNCMKESEELAAFPPPYDCTTPYCGTAFWLGAYDVAIAPWLHFYGAANVMGVLKEDLATRPGFVMDHVFKFLGLDPSEADPSYKVPEVVYPTPNKPGKLPARETCETLRGMYEPHVKCLDRMFGTLNDPNFELSKRWVGCDP